MKYFDSEYVDKGVANVVSTHSVLIQFTIKKVTVPRALSRKLSFKKTIEGCQIDPLPPFFLGLI